MNPCRWLATRVCTGETRHPTTCQSDRFPRLPPLIRAIESPFNQSGQVHRLVSPSKAKYTTRSNERNGFTTDSNKFSSSFETFSSENSNFFFFFFLHFGLETKKLEQLEDNFSNHASCFVLFNRKREQKDTYIERAEK